MSVKEEKSWSGRVRGVEESKYAAINNSAERKQSNPRNIQKKHYKEDPYFERREIVFKPRKGLEKEDKFTQKNFKCKFRDCRHQTQGKVSVCPPA